jgi:hypothetical protein
MKRERLHISTLVRIGQSILCIAAIGASALMVVDMHQRRTQDGMAPKPGSERTAPSHYYFIDARV